MGPPKKVKKNRLPYGEFKYRLNIFEYRWNPDTKEYYLFNPWTGETIFNITNLAVLDRNRSMWYKPDKYPSNNVETIELYPEFYASRRWGIRKFNGYNNDLDAAANHIITVMRGFMARLGLRRYFRARYHLDVCKYSGYFYYVDKYKPHEDTQWFKPRLAFPGDIQLITALISVDPDDPMQGKKYSRLNFTLGPFIKVSGLSKFDKTRAKQDAFLADNEWRDQAITNYSEIDFENATIGTIIAFFDGNKASSLMLSEYHLMRAAINGGDWNKVIKMMKTYQNNIDIQIFGFHSFAKAMVPLDATGILDFSASEAMQLAVDVIIDEEKKFSILLKIFAFNAFHNILSARAGRLDYLNTNLVQEQGDGRLKAVEKFIQDRFSIFADYLKYIPCEDIKVYNKGDKVPTVIQKPLQRSIDLVEANLKCCGVLAHEIESKEAFAFVIVGPVLTALKLCEEEASVMILGLQLLYNLCYRNEFGQESILHHVNPNEFIANIHYYHSGDPEVMRQCRKVELSLKHNGWRGHVEALITREINGEVIESEYLQPVLKEADVASSTVASSKK